MDGPKNKSQNNEFPSQLFSEWLSLKKKYGGAVTLLVYEILPADRNQPQPQPQYPANTTQNLTCQFSLRTIARHDQACSHPQPNLNTQIITRKRTTPT